MDKDSVSNIDALIGKKSTEKYEVTARDISRFYQAIGDEKNAKYGSECNQSLAGSPLICQMFAYSDAPLELLKQDGSPIELSVPLPTEKVMGGSSSFELGVPVMPGDTITATKTLADVYKKQGRSGLLYFVVVENVWTNQNDELVAHETATYIHR